MTQLDLLSAQPVRAKKRSHVPATSRLTYQAEQVFCRQRGEMVREKLAAHERFGHDAPTTAELASWHYFAVVDTDRLLLFRRGMSDLQAKGVVEKAGNRVCRVSGRTCATWRLTQR